MSSLDLKYAYSVLKRLTEKDMFMKHELFDIVTSNQTLDKLLDALEKDGYVVKKLNVYGRRTYEISLTDKGRAVAEQLRKAEDAARDEPIQISDDEAKEWTEKFHEATKGFSLLWRVNYYEDHIAITEEKDGKTRIINIYVKENGHDIMRLWCEEDDSFECIHVQYAWTLPEAQELYGKIVKGGK